MYVLYVFGWKQDFFLPPDPRNFALHSLTVSFIAAAEDGGGGVTSLTSLLWLPLQEAISPLPPSLPPPTGDDGENPFSLSICRASATGGLSAAAAVVKCWWAGGQIAAGTFRLRRRRIGVVTRQANCLLRSHFPSWPSPFCFQGWRGAAILRFHAFRCQDTRGGSAVGRKLNLQRQPLSPQAPPCKEPTHVHPDATKVFRVGCALHGEIEKVRKLGSEIRAGNETEVTRRDEIETATHETRRDRDSNSRDETRHDMVSFHLSRDEKSRDETRFETQYMTKILHLEKSSFFAF